MIQSEYEVQELNPTFLFTWKGTRTEKENYHNHDFPEVIYILSGKGRCRVEEVVYDIEEGDLLLLNPRQMHQFYPREAGAPAVEFFIGFTDIQLPGLLPNFVRREEDNLIIHTTGELRQKLFKICSSMEAENAVCRPGRYFMLKSYLMQLLLLIIREKAEPVEVKNGFAFESVNKKHVVEQILSYFEDHYQEKISLEQIAENMYLSPFYISKIFKSETGDTPIRHLINIRLERAYELLRSGTVKSVQEVAAMVGYEDAYHFSKLFKKKYGIPPSKVDSMTGKDAIAGEKV